MRWICVVAAIAGCRAGYGPAGDGDGDGDGRVQTGEAAIDDGSDETRAAIEPVDLDRALLSFGVAVDSLEPDDVFIRGELHADEIVFSRNGTDELASIRWNVIELPSATVQRGSFRYNGGTEVIDIDPVDLASSFAVFSCRSDGVDFSEDDMVRVDLAADRLEFTVEDPDTTKTVEYQVVSIPGARVQTGTTVLTGTDGSATAIPTVPIDRSRTFVTFSHSDNSGDDADIADRMLSAVIEADGSITFTRSATGSRMTVSWFLVELPAGYSVQSASTAIPAGELSATAGIDPVDTSHAFAVAGYLNSSGRVDMTPGDTPGGAWVTTALTDADSLELTRASSSGDADIGWFVIELP